MKLSLLSYLVS